MESKRSDLVKSMNSFFREAEQTIKELQDKLAKVSLERDMYKEQLSHSRKEETKGKVAYVPIYSRDNGEGVDTETCIGVFTTKPLAMQAILAVCNKNKEISIKQCMIKEYDVNTPLVPNEIVRVIQYNEEGHYEVANNVIGIYNETANNSLDDEYYLEEYRVNEVYHID